MRHVMRTQQGGFGLPWFKIVLAVAVVWGGVHHFQQQRTETVALEARGVPTSTTAMATLAASVEAEEVVMYSTTECGYCTEAKNWLTQNGFAFRECNMSNSVICQSEFKDYGASGTPFLIVRGHQMKNGFNTDEFFSALTVAQR